jgi:type IV secretory pathway TrbD component
MRVGFGIAEIDPHTESEAERMPMSNTMMFAARQPLAIVVLVVAVVAGLSIAIWLLPLGLVAYVLMVLIASRDPSTQTASTRTPRPRLTSPTFRSELARLEQVERDIQRSITQAGGPISRLLKPIGKQTSELIEEAYALCEKVRSLRPTLNRSIPVHYRNGWLRSTTRLVPPAIPTRCSSFQEARAALVDKQQNARDLQTYIGRVTAQLQNIGANLDNVLAETVRLRTADAVSADSATNQVAERLNDLKIDMDTFQRVLDTALASTTAP